MKPPTKRIFEVNLKRERKKAPSNYYRLVNLTVLGLFIGLIISLQLGFSTIISLKWVFRIALICIALSYLFQALFIKTKVYMKRMEYIAAAFFGGGPALMALFFILNTYIPSSSTRLEYKVRGVRHQGTYQYFNVDELPCEDYPELCKISYDDISIRKGTYLLITVRKGIFGFESIYKIEEIPD